MARWRRRKTRGGAHEPADVARRRTEIVGVSIDPRHDVANSGTGLFEFWTDQSVPVRLHDMDLISIEVLPVEQVLIVQFEYTERQWTPVEAVPVPVVVMRFEGVSVRWWNQEAAEPVAALGQVED